MKRAKLLYTIGLCGLLFSSALLLAPKLASADAVTDELLAQGTEKVEVEIKRLLAETDKFEAQTAEVNSAISELADELARLQALLDQYNKRTSEYGAEIARLKQKIKKLKELPTRYRVVSGDSLWKIASKKKIYNNPYKWVKLYSFNREVLRHPDNPHLIFPNQIFKISRVKIGAGAFPTQYEVAQGDSLWAISSLKKVYNDPLKWPTIYRANKAQITNPDVIYPYQVFDLPRE